MRYGIILRVVVSDKYLLPLGHDRLRERAKIQNAGPRYKQRFHANQTSAKTLTGANRA